MSNVNSMPEEAGAYWRGSPFSLSGAGDITNARGIYAPRIATVVFPRWVVQPGAVNIRPKEILSRVHVWHLGVGLRACTSTFVFALSI